MNGCVCFSFSFVSKLGWYIQDGLEHLRLSGMLDNASQDGKPPPFLSVVDLTTRALPALYPCYTTRDGM